MTALAGLWRYDGGPDSASNCASMLSSQALYGGDASGQWSSDGIALGRQLMRLLPEDKFDRQPLIGAGGRYVLVADLRLDNRGELIKLLRIEPGRSIRLSDADILLAAIERWGDEFVEKIVGEFALALWDSRLRCLTLTCDPLGQRPLYYHKGNRFFAFASMPKGLHALAAIPYELDEDRIIESFFPMPHTSAGTYFRGINAVIPGTIATITNDNLTIRNYWQPKIRRLGLRTAEDYSEGLCEVLDLAVSCRLRGATDVGAELSGGLDSSAVAATAARLLAPVGGRVIAFTSVPRDGYDGPVPPGRFANEGLHAAATAALYDNMEHILVRNTSKSPLDVLDRYFFLFDGPTSPLCNAAWGEELFNQARDRKLSILLNGMSGNLGMSYHGVELLGELFGAGRWFRLWREMRALKETRKMRWRSVFAQAAGPWCPMPMWMWLQRKFSAARSGPAEFSSFNPKRITELDMQRRVRDYGLNVHLRPWRDSKAMRLYFLRRTNSGSTKKGILGGWKIDYRDPTADVRLLEYCLSVPTEQFLHNGVQRALARRAFSDRLPKVVLEETRRGLQAGDWHETLSANRENIKIELERLSSCPAAARAFDVERLSELIKNWPDKGWDEPEIINAYRYVLAEAISMGHFIRRATGSNA